MISVLKGIVRLKPAQFIAFKPSMAVLKFSDSTLNETLVSVVMKDGKVLKADIDVLQIKLAAEEAEVLLKNEGNILPLAKLLLILHQMLDLKLKKAIIMV